MYLYIKQEAIVNSYTFKKQGQEKGRKKEKKRKITLGVGGAGKPRRKSNEEGEGGSFCLCGLQKKDGKNRERESGL